MENIEIVSKTKTHLQLSSRDLDSRRITASNSTKLAVHWRYHWRSYKGIIIPMFF